MLLVGNGRVISNAQDSYWEKGCVAIHANTILDVGNTQELKERYPEAQFIDAKGKVIMPGLINTHMHLYSTFARGMALKDAPPTHFVEILERLWWRLDKVLTLEDVYYSALISMIECIKNGTTTIFDHHASPFALRESLFTIAKAAEKLGLRSCLAYEVSDRDGEQKMLEGIRENLDFINYTKQRRDGILKGMFGLHASFTLSDQTLEKCREANAGSGFHVHVAEGAADLKDSLKRYGKGVVERLADFGILGPKSVASHCVHISSEEIGLLKESRTRVVHNPESNMSNAVGCAPVLEMVRQGVCVGLGTDGYTGDMFESLKVAHLLHKHEGGNPSVGVEVPQMLFQNNLEIGNEYFGRIIGRLTPGAYADLIIVDYNPTTRMDRSNASSHILLGMSGRAVDTVIINGRLVMQDRRIIGIDEEEIYAKAREHADKVWERF